MSRRMMPNRRECLTVEFAHVDALGNETPYRATYGFYDGIAGGEVGEIFLNAARTQGMLDAVVSEAAIFASHALQAGITPAGAAHMVKRNPAGRPSTPFGLALDMIDTVVAEESAKARDAIAPTMFAVSEALRIDDEAAP